MVNTSLTRPPNSRTRTAIWERRDADRRREPCPADKDALMKSTLETWAQINRVHSDCTTRTGAAGTIEANSGWGSRLQYTKPDAGQGGDREEWFTPFIEGYDGTNPAAVIECNGTTTTCVLDTGAACNLIGTETLEELMPNYRHLLQPTKTRARDVRDRPVPLAGIIKMNLKLGGTQQIQTEMEVVAGKDLLIIGNPLLY